MKADEDRTKANGMIEKFTEEDLVELNKILEIKMPTFLIMELEALISMLRDKVEANHVDVKFYLEDFEKFKFKMEYIDATTLNIDNVKAQRETMKRHRDDMRKEEESAKFDYIVEWGLQFAKHAIGVLEVSDQQKKIAALELKIKNAYIKSRKLETVVDFYTDKNIVDFHTGIRDFRISEKTIEV